MIYAYARVSMGGQSDAAQVRQLRGAGGGQGVPGSVERCQDRPAAATGDLLNTLAAITGKEAGFRSLADAWADTTTAHGRPMLTVLGGLAEFERELIRARTGEGRARAVARGQRMGRPPKLTPAQQAEARKRRAEGATLAELARSYGVGKSTISRL
jgi:DNA invertase Pin-like site-specific DNA recombinase